MKQYVGEEEAALVSFGALGCGYPGWDSQLPNFRLPKRESMVQVVTYPHNFLATLLSLGKDVLSEDERRDS